MNIKFIMILLFLSFTKIYSQGIFRSSSNNFQQVNSDSITSNEKPKEILNGFNFDSNAKSVDFSFLHPLTKRFWIGANIEGKSNSTIAKLFENGNFIPSSKLGINLVYDIKLKSKEHKKMNKKVEKYEKELANADNLIENQFRIYQISKGRDATLRVPLKAKIDTLKKIKDPILKFYKNKTDSIQNRLDSCKYIHSGLRMTLNLSNENRGFYNYILAQTFDTELIEQRKNIKDITFGINYYCINFLNLGPYIGGISVGSSNTDNFSELNEVSVSNTWKSEKGATSRSTSQKITAFEGSYNSSIQKYKVGLDQYFVPKFLKKRIGLSFNYSFNIFPNKEIPNHNDFTVGIFTIKDKDSPFSPNQGIIFKFTDVNKSIDLEPNKTRFSVGYTRQFNLFRILSPKYEKDKE